MGYLLGKIMSNSRSFIVRILSLYVSHILTIFHDDRTFTSHVYSILLFAHFVVFFVVVFRTWAGLMKRDAIAQDAPIWRQLCDIISQFDENGAQLSLGILNQEKEVIQPEIPGEDDEDDSDSQGAVDDGEAAEEDEDEDEYQDKDAGTGPSTKANGADHSMSWDASHDMATLTHSVQDGTGSDSEVEDIEEEEELE